jgi:hypothetical protein
VSLTGDGAPAYARSVRLSRVAGTVVLVTAIAGLLPAASSPGGTTTSARLYTPYSPSGRIVIRTSTRRGSCFSGSLATARRDAWRCSYGNYIVDPCFKSAARRDVVCPLGPSLRSGIRLALTRGLPRRYGNHRTPSTRLQPWALRLTDGAYCQYITGASSAIGSNRLNYFCRRGDPLWGSPRRSSQPWTIFREPSTAKRLRRRVPISIAWS